MPNTNSAKRTLRSQEKRRIINLRVLRALKTALREFLQNPTAEGLPGAYSAVDTAHKKGVIHANKADRIKSRLAARIAKANA